MSTVPSDWAHCWLLGAEGLHRSADGLDWVEIAQSGYPVEDLVRKPDKLFCATEWGLWGIATPTSQWVQLHDETLTEVLGIAPRPGHPGVAAVSTYGLSFGRPGEHGSTRWHSHTEGLTLNERFSNALLALPGAEGQWLVGTEDGVLIYDETADLWHRTELTGRACRALLHAHGSLWAGTEAAESGDPRMAVAGRGLELHSMMRLSSQWGQRQIGSWLEPCTGSVLVMVSPPGSAPVLPCWSQLSPPTQTAKVRGLPAQIPADYGAVTTPAITGVRWGTFTQCGSLCHQRKQDDGS